MAHCPIDPSPGPPRGDSLARLRESLQLMAGLAETEEKRMYEHGLSPNLRELVAGHLDGGARKFRRALALISHEGIARANEQNFQALGEVFTAPG